MPLAIARMCRAVCQRLPSFLLSSYNTLCTYTVSGRGPRQNNILETTLTNSSEYINDLV